jgi:serine/threonine-protein kinase OSR1/STK39
MASSSSTVAAHSYPVTPEGYEFLEELGHGENSAVYRAICPAVSNEAVAIKIVNLEGLRLSLDDLIKEIRVMSLSSHENVVPYRTSFSVGHHLWIVMPFVAGTPVGRVLRQLYPEGFPDEAIIRYILHGSLKGLEYFHRNRQIHRNIKADNILLTPDARVLLTDYTYLGLMLESGISRRLRQTFVGTPCWMAPEVMEQVSGYDYKADIWSFGITCIELAQGCAPYERFAPMKVLQLTLQGPPPTLEHPERFSAAFKAFVELCLQKDPRKRPTASELLEHPFMQCELPLEPNWAGNMLAKMPPLELNPLSEKERNSLQRGHVTTAGSASNRSGREPWSNHNSSNASLNALESQTSQIGRRSPEQRRNAMGISGWNFADTPELIEAKRERQAQRSAEATASSATNARSEATVLGSRIAEVVGSPPAASSPPKYSPTSDAVPGEGNQSAEEVPGREVAPTRRAGRFLLIDTEPPRPRTSPSTACLVHEDAIARDALIDDMGARASPRPGASQTELCPSDSSSNSSIRPRFYPQMISSRSTAPPELGIQTATSAATDEASTTITSTSDGVPLSAVTGHPQGRLFHHADSGHIRATEGANSETAGIAAPRGSLAHATSAVSVPGEAARRSSHGRFEVVDIPLQQAVSQPASARTTASTGAAAGTTYHHGSSASTGDSSPHHALYVSLAALDGVFQQPQNATRSPPRAPKPKSPPPPPSRWSAQTQVNSHSGNRGYASAPTTATYPNWLPYSRVSTSTSPMGRGDAPAAALQGRMNRTPAPMPLANVCEEDLLALLHHARGLQRTLSAILGGDGHGAAPIADLQHATGLIPSTMHPSGVQGGTSAPDSGSTTGHARSYVSPRDEHGVSAASEGVVPPTGGGISTATPGYLSGRVAPAPTVSTAANHTQSEPGPSTEHTDQLRSELSHLRIDQSHLRSEIENLRHELASMRMQLMHLTALSAPSTPRVDRPTVLPGGVLTHPDDTFVSGGQPHQGSNLPPSGVAKAPSGAPTIIPGAQQPSHASPSE